MYSADCGNGAGDQLQDAFSNGRINEEHVFLGAGSSCFGIFICVYFDFSTYGKAGCRDKQTVCNDIYGGCKKFFMAASYGCFNPLYSGIGDICFLAPSSFWSGQHCLYSFVDIGIYCVSQI